MDPGPISPRNVLLRERHALKLLVDQSKENEKKRLAHLLILGQRATNQLNHIHIDDASSGIESKMISPDEGSDLADVSMTTLDIETLHLYEDKYNKEREEEQKKIAKSFEEYSALKAAFLKDEMRLAQSSRDISSSGDPQVEPLSSSKQTRTNTASMTNKSLRSRFAGLQNQQDHAFHTYICKKFEKDFIKKKIMAEKAQVRYNPIEEKTKLKLLQEKKDILTKMIGIQNKALNEIHSQSLDSDMKATKWSKFDSASSLTGYTKTSCGESWATFGPGLRGTTPSLQKSNQPPYKLHKDVPRLQLDGL